MSIYSVHKVCYLANHDPAFREQLRQDPVATLAELRLTDQERTALLNGDVSTLALLGAHGYLLGQLARYNLLGLDRDTYSRNMDPAKTRMQEQVGQR